MRGLTDARSLALGHGREEFGILMAFIACPRGVGAQGIIEGSFWVIVSMSVMIFLLSSLRVHSQTWQESIQESIQETIGQLQDGIITRAHYNSCNNFSDFVPIN